MWRSVKTAVDFVATLLVCGAAAAVLWMVIRPAPQPPGSRPAVEKVQGLSISAADVSHVSGSGQVALVEFSDYECPFCARHTLETAPLIKKQLLDAGGIRHVFFSYPLAIHPRAPKASEAAECAGKQGKFWEMHESLFAESRKLDPADLLARAESLKLDQASFKKCLDDGEMAPKVRRDMDAGRRLGVRSTPAFFVGRLKSDGSIELVSRINGAVPFDQFDNAIRALLPAPRQARR